MNTYLCACSSLHINFSVDQLLIVTGHLHKCILVYCSLFAGYAATSVLPTINGNVMVTHVHVHVHWSAVVQQALYIQNPASGIIYENMHQIHSRNSLKTQSASLTRFTNLPCPSSCHWGFQLTSMQLFNMCSCTVHTSQYEVCTWWHVHITIGQAI